MWACQHNWMGTLVGKYHWFEAETKDEFSMFSPLCKTNVRMYRSGVMFSKRKQPRHADRCKRCVAALERRKDENAKG